MPKPVRKANLVHQQVLGALIETKPTSWDHKTLVADPQKPGATKVVKTKVKGSELRYPLAQNVAPENVERIAQRWIR